MAIAAVLQVADFTAIPLDICLQRGDSPIIPFTLFESDGVTPIDISASVITLTVDTLEEPTDALTQVFQVSHVLVGGGTNGQFTLQPSTSDTDLDPNIEHFHDIHFVLAAFGQRTIFKGKFITSQDINKA